jgi:hypothetical protein
VGKYFEYLNLHRLAQSGHSVAFLDTIFKEDILANVRHIHAYIPKREDEEWKQKMTQILWHSRLYTYSLVGYHKMMDEYFGTIVNNYTEKVILKYFLNN